MTPVGGGWPPSRENRTETSSDGMTWKPGAKFRVIRDGARFSGMVPDLSLGAGVLKGWRRYLSVGEVIECAGYGAGFGSDPGFGVDFRDPEGGLVEFYPTVGGIFNYRPMPGYLEPVDE